MKVLLDMHVSFDFKACLIDALGPSHEVHRAYDLGWDTMENGVLQKAAKDAGYCHVVTYDKAMADEHPHHLPVLTLDNPSHGDAGREPGDMTADEVWQMTIASAAAVARKLIHEPSLESGYHGVAVPGYKPRKALRRILEGKHRQHPDYEANRQQYIEEQRAKSRNPDFCGEHGHGGR